MKTIVAGYDGTSSAERALTRVGELAQAFGSRVVVVTVAAPLPAVSVGAYGLTPLYYPQAGDSELPRPEVEEHRSRVEGFFAGLGVPVEFVSTVGLPAEAIVELAVERRADLIVVGTREPGFLERLFGGSVSEGVARRARCDVLIVHPPEEDEEPS